jgi:hypothetical protein
MYVLFVQMRLSGWLEHAGFKPDSEPLAHRSSNVLRGAKGWVDSWSVLVYHYGKGKEAA